MLRQYQLHGGIRRLQTHIDQSKRFGTTTTMAAPSAPSPWNRPPPLVDDFRWWDNIFLNSSLPCWLDEAPSVHKKNSAEVRHGETQDLLVHKLERYFLVTKAASFAVVQVDETLKKPTLLTTQNTQP